MADTFQGIELALETFGVIAVTAQLNIIQTAYDTLAKNYYTLYKTQRDFYFNNFQVSGELPFVTEQFGVAFYGPDYGSTNHVGYLPPSVGFLFYPQEANRIASLGSPTTAGYWSRYGSRYGSSQEQAGSYFMDLASLVDDWSSYQFRYEEHKRDVLNERRWASQMGALSYGVKEAYNVESGLGTSFQVMDEAQGQLISQDSTIVNGLATYIGNKQARKALKEDLAVWGATGDG